MLNNEITIVVNRLNEISKCFKELFLNSDKYSENDKIKITYYELSDMFKLWSNALKDQKALILDKICENMKNNNNKPKKDRLTIAKECLFKMINSMNDKVQMALTTFDVESKLVISLSPKEELKSISNNINKIQAGGGTDLTKALEGRREM